MQILSPATRHYVTIWDSLILQDEIRKKKNISKDGNFEHLQILLPKALRNEVLQQMHNSVISGHLGNKKTAEKTRKSFYWFEMREDIRIWINKCQTCQLNKFPVRTPKASGQ
jgi:hypothetical protein